MRFGIVAGLLGVCVSAQSQAQSSFIMSENALSEVPGYFEQVSDGHLRIWCGDTQWIEDNLEMSEISGAHFYGDGGVSSSEEKIYFSFKISESDQLVFSKIKYSPSKTYTNASLGAIIGWQADIIFDKDRAASRVAADGIAVEAVDDAGWNVIETSASTTGGITIAYGESPGSFFSTAEGTTVELVWNRQLAEYLGPSTPQDLREQFVYAMGRFIHIYVTNELGENTLCSEGSIFVISDVSKRITFKGFQSFIIDYAYTEFGDQPRISETSDSARAAAQMLIIQAAF